MAKILLGVFILVGVFILSSHKASAATIAVENDCSLNDAINAINSGSDTLDCISTGSAYGTNDTINIPAGTYSPGVGIDPLSSNQDITIHGQGMGVTIIDMAGELGFHSSDKHNTIKLVGFTITNASESAVDFVNAEEVEVNQVEVKESCRGVAISAQSTLISNSYIHNNTDCIGTGSTQAGVNIGVRPLVNNDPSYITISETRIMSNVGTSPNSDSVAGLFIHANGFETSPVVRIEKTTVGNNSGKVAAGIEINAGGLTLAQDLKISSVTVNNNSVTATEASSNISPYDPARTAGFIFNVTNLVPQINMSNVTVANNSVTNAYDNHVSLAGFFGIAVNLNNPLKIVNSTVVGNTVTQTTASYFGRVPAFLLLDTTLVDSTPTEVNTAGSGQNNLIAHNLYNNTSSNCRSDLDASLANLSGNIDLTPINLGHNFSDDQTCTGYTYSSNLYSTIDHQVADNGGPVPTIKLHTDSPAINGGVAVLGISTDARGIAREGYYSVGAYQGVLAASTTTPNGPLANTGAIAISSTLLMGVIISSVMFIYFDYKKHKTPLVLADPSVRYTLGHHLKVVTLPLLRYRLQFTFSKADDGVLKKF